MTVRRKVAGYILNICGRVMRFWYLNCLLACVVVGAQAHAQALLADSLPLIGFAPAIARGDFPKTDAVVIMSGGRLAYEAYFGTGSRARLNDTRSAMKSVTALAAGLAIADGAIPSVKSRAFSYMADLAPFAHDS